MKPRLVLAAYLICSPVACVQCMGLLDGAEIISTLKPRTIMDWEHCKFHGVYADFCCLCWLFTSEIVSVSADFLDIACNKSGFVRPLS